MKKVYAGLFCAFLFASSAVFGDVVNETGSEKAVTSELGKLLEQRFFERWQALIGKNFKVAYGLESSVYRTSVGLPDYVSSYHPDLTWNSVTIDEVNIEDKTKAVVSYSLSFTFKTDWGTVFENTDLHDEEWFFENGEWWHDKKVSVSPYSAVLNRE